MIHNLYNLNNFLSIIFLFIWIIYLLSSFTNYIYIFIYYYFRNKTTFSSMHWKVNYIITKNFKGFLRCFIRINHQIWPIKSYWNAKIRMANGIQSVNINSNTSRLTNWIMFFFNCHDYNGNLSAHPPLWQSIGSCTGDVLLGSMQLIPFIFFQFLTQ